MKPASTGSVRRADELLSGGVSRLFVMLQWALVAIASIVTDLGRSSEKGLAKLRDLDDWSAAQLQQSYRATWVQRLLLAVAVPVAGFGVWSAATGSWWYAAQAGVAAGALLAAWQVHRVAGPKILNVLAERDLSGAGLTRERSVIRSRRVTQFAVAAGAFFVASSVALAVAEIVDLDWAPVVGLALLLVSLLALAGAGWASVWRYGDEVPAER